MNAQRQCRSFLADKDPPPQHSSNYFLADNAHAIAITLFRSRLFSCQMKTQKRNKDKQENSLEKKRRPNNNNNNSFLCFIFTPCRSQTRVLLLLDGTHRFNSRASAVIKRDGSILGGLSIAHIARHLLLLTYYPDRKKRCKEARFCY
jgi:hypothetical protein